MTDDDPTFTAAVAAQLRAERAAQGMTLEELAERSGIPMVSVQRYLRAKRGLNAETIKALAEAMGTTAGEIIEGAEARHDKAVANRGGIEDPGEESP